MRVALRLEYIGTAYAGWQRQKNGVAIQQVVEDALSRLLKQEIRVTGAGRTDAGVHAMGQVCSFDYCGTIPPDRLQYAVNPLLPADIRAIGSWQTQLDFHPVRDAVEKTYCYMLLLRDAESALYANRVWRVSSDLDLIAMRQAAAQLEGTHDFSSFMAAGSQVKTTVRTIYRTQIQQKGELVAFVITGNGFLYNMVRIMMGTLVEIGRGKRDANTMQKIIGACTREAAGITAPAWGLYMQQVKFNEKAFYVQDSRCVHCDRSPFMI